MNYKSPDAADLANVYALNDEFLRVARGGGNSLLDALPGGVADRLASLSAVEMGRLSHTPFLLFTIGETDARRWQALFKGEPALQLFEAPTKVDTREQQVAIAALAFLWQLVQRQPYAARVISGASKDWCEQLAACTLVTPMQALSVRKPVLTFRLNTSLPFWRKLLLAATSDDRSLRIAARLSALQTLLTQAVAQPERLSRAACSMQAPRRQRLAPPGRVDHAGVADEAVSKLSARGYNTPPHECTDHQKPEQDVLKR